MGMHRRDALKSIGVLAGAGAAARLLPACGDDDDPGPSGITTYVVLMMENRSYDHLLGARKLLEGRPGDGLLASMSNPALDGRPVAPYPATFTTGCVPDPPHGWGAAHESFAAGAMNGFVHAHQARYQLGANDPMQYLTREMVPVSWALADAYASCDRWFCSVMGPTWPNRMYWMSGTSQGIRSNQIPVQGFSWDHIFARLDAAGVPWRYYYGNIPVVSLIEGYAPGDRMRRFDDFFSDARDGTLPPVVYIDPSFFGNDDHPPLHPLLGQQLISSIYIALATSPQWKNCMFLVTYDENGGFFDHVPPPTSPDAHAADGFDQLGFRVPTIAAGPYVKSGYVSSVPSDHTSVLRHFEKMFSLAPLTMRSSAASDLSDLIDGERLAAGDWASPADIPSVEVDYSAIDSACGAMRQFSAEHPVLAWADAMAPRLGELDRRKYTQEDLLRIGDYLERHGAGRIRR